MLRLCCCSQQRPRSLGFLTKKERRVLRIPRSRRRRSIKRSAYLGWTATIRPPSSYTNKLKTQQIKEYRYQEKRLSEFEEDHLISLQLGGYPTDARNLWPQPYRIKCGARIKDVLETRLKRMVCEGKLTLAQAQKEIATNWIAAYKKYVDKEGCPRSTKNRTLRPG